MSQSLPSVCFYCADQNLHRDRSRGITGYTRGLLAHLRDSNTVKLTALVSKSSFALPDRIEELKLPFSTDHLVGRILGDHLHPMMTSRSKADIWHYPKGFLPAILQVKAKRVGTIADVMLQFEADNHPASRARLAFDYWIWVLKRSIQNLDLILTISEFSKQSILEFCGRHRLGCPPIIVTYLGVEVLRPAQAEPETKEDYVVHLASKFPYKATTWLLEQWLSLGREGRELPELKLIGALDSRGKEIFSRMKGVSLVPPLARNILETTIAKARALLLPSEIEGFGIPLVEGYLLGTPVAYTRGTALEEIIGPDSPGGFWRERDSFHTALREVLEMDRATVDLKAVALKAKYSWDPCVRRTLDAYRTVLG